MNTSDRGLLYLLYAVSLLIGIIVGCIAIYQFIAPGLKTSTPPDGGVSTGSCSSFSREDLGLWEYQRNRPAFPPAPGDCQVIVAHGDINDSGTCHIKVFHTGEP